MSLYSNREAWSTTRGRLMMEAEEANFSKITPTNINNINILIINS
jgi:hypothetical protein